MAAGVWSHGGTGNGAFVRAEEREMARRRRLMEKKVGLSLLALQSAFVALFAVFAEYDEEADSLADGAGLPNSFHRLYGMFQDVHVMIFIGFGFPPFAQGLPCLGRRDGGCRFLMTFLRRYGYSAVSYNLLLSALAIQWYTIVQAIIKLALHDPVSLLPFSTFVDQGDSVVQAVDGELAGPAIPISQTTLIEGDFAAATILISFGVLLGKTSPCQLLALVMLEVPIYALNLALCTHLGVSDAGGPSSPFSSPSLSFHVPPPGSIVIHLFGAYFGVAVALVLPKNWTGDEEDNNSVYHSDLFSMVGTVFLWIYWPSFNGVLLPSSLASSVPSLKSESPSQPRTRSTGRPSTPTTASALASSPPSPPPSSRARAA